MKRASLTFALLASIGAASMASATDLNSIVQAPVQSADSRIELGLVRAATDGVVQIYSYHAGNMGALLGETTVHAGANPDVSVNVGTGPATTVIAVLYDNNGNATTQEILDFKN